MTSVLIERGVRMNCVSPVAVETPILEDFTHAFGDRARRGIEMIGRFAMPGKIAETFAFLANSESEWVRGCNIDTDGGLTAMLETKAKTAPK
jgi:NAD(P)-dependent dehydrogenase (short-subunit alcohol dehydrogenase family)